MLFDKENLFSATQEVETTTASTDLIDLGVDRDVGGGEEVYLVVVVDETVTASGAATVTFALQTDNDVAFGSANDIYTSDAIGKADMTAGTVILKIPVPRVTERYLRLNYTVATGPLTAGKFTAGIVKDVDAYRSYPSGYTVAD